MTILDRPLKWRTISGLSRRRRYADLAATVLVGLAMVVALTPLVWVLCVVTVRGITAISAGAWWTHSEVSGTGAEAGGAYHAIVGTLLLGLLCAVISVPFGVLVGIYLVEYGDGRWPARLVTFAVDAMAGVPSIVAALFIYAVWVMALGLPRSQFAVSLALLILMLPVIARATEEMLRLVPTDLREASYALGIPKWKTIVKVVLPTSLSGILTGIMLALARVIGETSPLLVLVGYSHAMKIDIFGVVMGSLPGMIYHQSNAGGNSVTANRLWGAALTLILFIAMINIGARVVARVFVTKKA